jgi:hypothetical protein
VLASNLRSSVRRTRQPSRPPTDSDADEAVLLCWPLDHYYSPVPDNRELQREPARSRVWPATPRVAPGIDWRDDDQIALLSELSSQDGLEFPDEPTGDTRDYHAANDMFSRLDAWMLQAMVRRLRPRRMIEVGCGWSSLVTARVNREYLNSSLHFTCIEPYPPAFLEGSVDGISQLIVSRVEELSTEPFLELGDRDILFIDSSHTVKTGGDVAFLFGDVLPRLAPGVAVHIHDVFLPSDYPQDWVFAGRAWNEQYLVAAFLAFNAAFRVLLGVSWLSHHHPDALAAAIPDYGQKFAPGGGCSLWIQRGPSG